MHCHQVKGFFLSYYFLSLKWWQEHFCRKIALQIGGKLLWWFFLQIMLPNNVVCWKCKTHVQRCQHKQVVLWEPGKEGSQSGFLLHRICYSRRLIFRKKFCCLSYPLFSEQSLFIFFWHFLFKGFSWNPCYIGLVQNL